MTKPNAFTLILLVAGAVSAGCGIVWAACTSGAVASANDRCLEPPGCSYTTYFTSDALTDPAYGATCETCSWFYQGCDSAGTNAFGTNALWAQLYAAPYYAASNVCGVPLPSGRAVSIGPASTSYTTLDSGCGEAPPGALAPSRPVQIPIPIQRPIPIKLQP
jgi:hypothetical protein